MQWFLKLSFARNKIPKEREYLLANYGIYTLLLIWICGSRPDHPNNII